MNQKRTEKYDYIMSRMNLDLAESQKKLAAYLIVQRGGDVLEEQRLPIYTGSTLFGSAKEAVGLFIKGVGVSSIHGIFEISPDAKEHFIEDFDSTNGTFIGDYKIAPRRLYQLSHQKILTFGPTKCVYEIMSDNVKSIHSRPTTPEIAEMENVNSRATTPGSPELFTDEVSLVSLDLDVGPGPAKDKDLGETDEEFEAEKTEEVPEEMNVDEKVQVQIPVKVSNTKDTGSDEELEKKMDEKVDEIVKKVSVEVVKPRQVRKEVVDEDMNVDEEFETKKEPVKKGRQAKKKQVPVEVVSVDVDMEGDLETKNEPVKKSRQTKKKQVPVVSEEEINVDAEMVQEHLVVETNDDKSKQSKEKDITVENEEVPSKKEPVKKRQIRKKEIPLVEVDEQVDDLLAEPKKRGLKKTQKEIPPVEVDEQVDDLTAEPKKRGLKKTQSESMATETPVARKKRQRKTSDHSLDMSMVSEPRSAKGRKRGSKVDYIDAKIRILFTGIPDSDPRRKIVKQLGATEVDDWHQCTHLITDRIRRTVKFLCCLSAGKYIMDISWLDASKAAQDFVEEAGYLLTDKDFESKNGFSLKESLRLTQDESHPRLFEGVEMYATTSVNPPPEHLKEILESAGGKMLFIPPKKSQKHDKLYIIGDIRDVKECDGLRRMGYTIYSKELVLTGLLKQQLDLEGYQLQEFEP